MIIAREETFGPVAPMFRFDTKTEAVRMAGTTPNWAGLIFLCRDLARSWRVAEALNTALSASIPA